MTDFLDGPVFRMGITPGVTVGTTYGEGVYPQTATITIPRQRAELKNKYPIPFLAGHHPTPAGVMRGVDDVGSVLAFDSSITGRYIQTEDYNPGLTGDTVSTYWNDGNIFGDTSLRYNHQARVTNLTVLGNAQLHPYPWATNGPIPDPYGPDFVRIADGLCMQGSGHQARHLRFYGIPGACLIMKNGTGSQGGVFSPIEDGGINPSNLASWIFMSTAMYGLSTARGTDTKLDHIYGGGFVHDGIIGGNNTILTNAHIAGADRALVAAYPIHCSDIYMEASRIGVHLTGSYTDPETGGTVTGTGAFKSSIDDLQIGPGSNWYRSVLCSGYGSGSSITGVTGYVRAEDATYPDIAAIEIEDGTNDCTIKESIEHLGIGKSLILAGNRHTAQVNTYWGGAWAGKIVECRHPLYQSDVAIRGQIGGGWALDLLNSSQATVNGLGTVFDIKVVLNGSAAAVRYPAGKTAADLAGTKIYINGVLQ